MSIHDLLIVSNHCDECGESDPECSCPSGETKDKGIDWEKTFLETARIALRLARLKGSAALIAADPTKLRTVWTVLNDMASLNEGPLITRARAAVYEALLRQP